MILASTVEFEGAQRIDTMGDAQISFVAPAIFQNLGKGSASTAVHVCCPVETLYSHSAKFFSVLPESEMQSS